MNEHPDAKVARPERKASGACSRVDKRAAQLCPVENVPVRGHGTLRDTPMGEKPERASAPERAQNASPFGILLKDPQVGAKG